MNAPIKMALRLVVAMCLLSRMPLPADVGDAPANPYLPIVKRNAFQLNPPKPRDPTPPPPAEPEPEEVDIMVSGFARIKDVKKVYFAIPDLDNTGKFKFLDIEEGNKEQGIEVLRVDEKMASVQVKHNSKLLSLNLEEHGFKSSKRPPARPSPRKTASSRTAATRRTTPPRPAATRPTSATSTGPRIISRGGIMNQPNNNPSSTANRSSATTTRTSRTSGQLGATTSSGTTSRNTTLRSIPRRSRITSPTFNHNMSPEEQAAMILINKEKRESEGIPMPPTPFVPPE